MPSIEKGHLPWITPRRAAMLLGCSERNIFKLAVLGRIRVLVEPGENIRINREDVEKIAVEKGLAAHSPA